MCAELLEWARRTSRKHPMLNWLNSVGNQAQPEQTGYGPVPSKSSKDRLRPEAAMRRPMLACQSQWCNLGFSSFGSTFINRWQARRMPGSRS